MFVVFSVKLLVELEFQLLYIGGGANCLQNAIHTGVLNAQHFGRLHIVETDDALMEQALLRWHRNRIGQSVVRSVVGVQW